MSTRRASVVGSAHILHARSLTERMKPEELREVTKAFDEEMVLYESRPLTAAERKAWETARRKPGRPRRGSEAKVISVIVERGQLARSDALPKELGVSRASLIERGLRTVLEHAHWRSGGRPFMTRVELTEATAPLADYARKARRGPVVLTRRGRPVALLRLLTDEEREDFLVSTHPGFMELIKRSREECPPGSGVPLEDVERELGLSPSRPVARRRRGLR